MDPLDVLTVAVARDGARWRAHRSSIVFAVEDYVRRFPGQCPRLTFQTAQEAALGTDKTAGAMRAAPNDTVRRSGLGDPG